MSGISSRVVELHAAGDCWTGCPICKLEDEAEADE